MGRILKASSIAVLLVSAIAAPAYSSAEVSVGVSVNIGPPPLPYYPQPLCPGPGFIWTPGYWAYGPDGYFWVPGYWAWAPDGYYWVPGYWAAPPFVGALWTPGWWGWSGDAYIWHVGYWGPHVGFYGGINYGYGYGGVGYGGGYWHGNAFYYNRAITNVNVTVIHNTYNQTVGNNVSRVSYNGGTGGVTAVATAQEESYAHEQRVAPTSAQMKHEQAAASNPGQRFSANNGHPDVAATARPGKFNGNGAVTTNAARDNYEYHPHPHQERAARPMHEARPHPPRERGGGHPPGRHGGHTQRR